MTAMERMTGKKRVITILVLLLVAGFLAVSLSVYRVARETVLESISTHQLPLTGDNIYSEIQKDLLRPIFISSMMAQDTFLRDWALAGEGDESAVVRYLKEIKERYQTVTAFFISEKSRAYYHHSGRFKTVSEADPRDSWYFRVRALTEPYEINVDPDWTNRETLTIFINYRVFDYRGNFIGTTGVGLTVDTVRHLLESYQARFKRRITFVDRQGKVAMRGSVAHIGADSLAEAPGIGALASAILATGPAGALLEYRHEGAQWLVNTRFIPELNWHLMVEQSVDESLKPAQAALARSLAISLVVTVIVTLLAAVVLTYFQRRLETMATVDSLTGLLNRQAMELVLAQSIRDAERNRVPLAAIMFDLDHFKTVNDRFGHQAGDEVLRRTAQTVKSALRASDVVGRWGGEEFLVALKDCPLDRARGLADKIRAALAQEAAAQTEEPRLVTVSLGVALYRSGETVEKLLDRTDVALYRAKNLGRDRAEVEAAF